MAERNSDRIRSVIRPRYGGQMQNPANHVHDLPFFRLAVSDDRLLYLHGRVLIYRNAAAKCAEQDDAAGMRHRNTGRNVFAEEKLFNRNRLRIA